LHAGIDIESCTRCGGTHKVIASIEEPAVIAQILVHLAKNAPAQSPLEMPPLSGWQARAVCG
jgi:hypothetical protein